MSTILNQKAGSQNEKESKKRLASIDILRGFDMFWIVGGAGFIASVLKFFGPAVQNALIPQLHHAKWEGFHFYDLIFPLFVFITGMSAVYSLQNILKSNGIKAAYKRLIRRTILLYLFGIIYYHGIENGYEQIRLLGVLQRLALTYFFTGVIYIHFNLKGIVIAFPLLLLSYWALLSFVPLPGSNEISFTATQNWAYWFDKQFLPLRKHFGDWDPEGLLSTIPAIGSALLGAFAAILIKNKNIADMKKVYYMIGGGAGMVVIGFLWGLQFPVIKNIWTSSYVLVAGGYSFILFGLLYLIVDIWKFDKWAIPFIWIGMNPITIYLARNFFNFNNFAKRFVGGELHTIFGETFGNFLLNAVSMGLTLLLVRFMYKKKIFLRI